jgi:hypothetical protein
MYGLVNQAMRDMVISAHGESRWAEICSRAGTSDGEFVAMQPYPDSLTYGLVGAASEVLATPAGDLLKAFGDYWINFTALQGYGEMMDLFGRDFISCLRNLNGMHAHMGVMMPELRPPRFEVSERAGGGGQVFDLKYFSKREGLTPFVQGLLEGLARKFGQKAEIRHVEAKPGPADGPEFFEIRLSS